MFHDVSASFVRFFAMLVGSLGGTILQFFMTLDILSQLKEIIQGCIVILG